MGKIRNWAPLVPGADSWLHAKKSVYVHVMKDTYRPYHPDGDTYRAFFVGSIIKKSGSKKAVESNIVQHVSKAEARKQAMQWMRAHPGGGVVGAISY